MGNTGEPGTAPTPAAERWSRLQVLFHAAVACPPPSSAPSSRRAVWNFWFLDSKLNLYPKIDIGYRFGSWSGASLGGFGGIIFQGSAGVAYHLGDLALRAEAGSGSLRLGVGYVF